METSQAIKSSNHPTFSPCGTYIAILNNDQLEIYDSKSLQPIRFIPTTLQTATTRWSPLLAASKQSTRILLFTEERLQVWDLQDEKWSATISNGSGGMGKIVNAEFGQTSREILAFSDFGSKLTVWNLSTGRSAEVRDPKFPTAGKGFEFRPSKTGLMALLTRPGPQDILLLQCPGARMYKVAKTVVVQTVDAQGLKWSPDGMWLAIWDTASVGYRVLIYTADGNLYREYHGDTCDEELRLGIRSLEWSPDGTYLAIGGSGRRVTLLSTRTFSPTMHLDHTSTIQLPPNSEVWQETITTITSSTHERSYATMKQPISPPTVSTTLAPSTNKPAPKPGVSTVAFSADGSVLATLDELTPSTLWLWDLKKLTAKAVVIQHSPVRTVTWHPTKEHLLLVTCAHEEAVVYMYDSANATPLVLQIPFQKSSGKLDSRWLLTPEDRKPALSLSDASSFVVVYPDGKDQILRFSRSERNGSIDETRTESEEEDSLFDILTGKTPVKPFGRCEKEMDRTELLVSDVLDEETEVLDDTFVGRGLRS